MRRLALLVMFLLAIAVVCAGCAHQDDWTRRDSAMYAGTLTVLAADAITTSRIQDCLTCEEGGMIARPILGANPSDRDVALYFGTLAVSNYLIGRALPERWRPYWFGSQIAIHGAAVVNNCNKELC